MLCHFISCKIAINIVIYSYYHTKFGKSQHAKIACLTGLTLRVECAILFMLGNRGNEERFIVEQVLAMIFDNRPISEIKDQDLMDLIGNQEENLWVDFKERHYEGYRTDGEKYKREICKDVTAEFTFGKI